MAMNDAMVKLLADEEGSTIAPLDLRFGDRVLVPIGADKVLHVEPGQCPPVRCVVLEMSSSYWWETSSVSVYFVREEAAAHAWEWTQGHEEKAGRMGHLVERHVQPVEERIEVWP